MQFVLCVLGAVLGAVAQSPLKIAHCRANCILQFSTQGNRSDCIQELNCRSCWDGCERLKSDWSQCEADHYCNAGCQQACRFHQQITVQRPPVSVTRGREVILLSGDSVVWPPPIPSSDPHVFVLMCRRQDNSWTQITQTLLLSWRLPHKGDCRTVRVMVVGAQGLVTVYSPAPGPLQDAGLILRSVGKDIWGLQNGSPNDQTKEMRQLDGGWSLREVSQIHQGVLVIAEVSWNPQSSSVYLVTWELAGGGLKGHLLTDSTSVTLSLWPDTVYHIQAQEVRDPQKVSERLVLDTRQATPHPLPPAGVPPSSLGHPGFESVTGVAAAILVFLGVAMFLSRLPFRASKCADELHTSDHYKLFPPPVRLLVQPASLGNNTPCV